jgi:hypothetical protein
MFKGLKMVIDTIVNDLEKVGMNAIDENLSVMADLNTEQMTRGLNIEGETIGEYRSPKYAAMKQSMNSRPPAFVPDLKLTGDFHSGVFAKRNGNDLVFGGTDGKTNDLVRKYGPILGLTEESQTDVTDNYVFPVITSWLKTQLQRI